MTQETSTTTDNIPARVTIQTFNDRTEVLSVLGALMHPVHPGSVSVALDALVTLLAIARQDERTQCLEEQLADAKVDKALAEREE